MSPLIFLKTENSKALIGLLKAVHFRDLATFFVSKNGVKVTVEDAKCIQGNAFLQADLFEEFKLIETVVAFKINLNVLLDCLSVFGTSNSMISVLITYKDHGSTLDILLEENGVIAECNIKTMDALEILDFDFSSSQASNKIILKSECMHETFSELDSSSEVLEVAIIPSTLPNPRLRLTTYGYTGTTHYDFPRDSDAVEVFDCNEVEPKLARYRLSLLRPSTHRALALSSRVCLRMNIRGFLSLQYMIHFGSSDSQASFVEFYCVPDEDDCDDEENRHLIQDLNTNTLSLTP